MTIAEGNNRYRQIIEDAVAEAVARKAAREIAGQKERRFLVSEVKWVVVERQNMSGRYVALPGVSYPTQAEAEAHILEKFDPRYHDRYHVESRAVKKSDEGKRMHCQACGRAILTKRGTIAHHGYGRPEAYQQTASCMGAKELPFEVDRKVLGRLIVALKDMQTRMQGVRDHIAREVLPVERQYTVGFGPKVEKRSFKFWRITFESEQSQEALHHGGWFDYKFDDLLKAELASHDGRLRSIAREIKDQQARYDGWRQTHEWGDGDGLWATLNKRNEIDNGNAR
jgi:hypothetical protein